MKVLFILVTLLTSLSSSAVTIVPSVLMIDNTVQSGELSDKEASGIFSTVKGLTTSTTVASPVAGVIVFADSERVMIDLQSERALEEIELIQISLDEGEELSDFQNAVLEIGVANGQLDIDAYILK
jgi:hypothetical protein